MLVDISLMYISKTIISTSRYKFDKKGFQGILSIHSHRTGIKISPIRASCGML